MLKISMTITKNKIVSIDYTLRGADDEIIDISGSEPMMYLHGHENIIPGLEKAMEGKAAGDSFKVFVPTVEAYGIRDQNLVIAVPRSSFDGVEKLEEGMQFEAQFPNGSQIVTIIKVTENDVTVDGNHPLAGMDLNFDIAIKEIRDATEEEIAHGHPHYEHGHCGCHEEDGCDSCNGCNADHGCHSDDDDEGDGCGGCCHH